MLCNSVCSTFEEDLFYIKVGGDFTIKIKFILKSMTWFNIYQKEGDILIHTLTFCISGAFCCKKALCGWTSWKIQLSKTQYDRCWSGEVSYCM